MSCKNWKAIQACSESKKANSVLYLPKDVKDSAHITDSSDANDSCTQKWKAVEAEQLTHVCMFFDFPWTGYNILLIPSWINEWNNICDLCSFLYLYESCFYLLRKLFLNMLYPLI